ncbi:MAG: hypothetical protein IJ622_02745 [Bacteroidales bacterium]|nr:hypothetical protein [Bacteroidales bacterium]
MKRFWYAATLSIALLFLGYSCGSKGADKPSSTSTDIEQTDDFASFPEDMETDTIDDDDDGDPNIKAASVDHMKMVIDSRGNVEGRYVRTNQTSYTVAVQDDMEVPKIGHKIVTYSAKNGQGIVYTQRTHVNVRKEPDMESIVITQISTEKGEMPETYPCLGKTKGWYKIRVKNAVGYVRHDLVIWDGMDTF